MVWMELDQAVTGAPKQHQNYVYATDMIYADDIQNDCMSAIVLLVTTDTWKQKNLLNLK